MLTNSLAIKQIGTLLEKLDARIWQLSYQGKVYQVTFYPECFDERPGLQDMSWKVRFLSV
ncbi:hypothetical protein NG798_22570 [Ancylothrix sp. C2]|uniref:hypothetical protein n=1 Tax=Ancylothrix sp. D3o TaxID=2953691 RepID=UPI0021BAE586|nr:hypothetical protein [Ancylothrix sp. D3o]MCT7952585.1 hypothetical protein [Ancylothrix sp. D3o]